jgi:GNAT superfamily N-acetyltransferase
VTTVRIERLTGERLRDLLPELARLRITVFRAFPYLYDGSLDYEQRYLRTYAEAADSVIVGAFDGEVVVGASTGLPLAHEPAALTQPFVAHGFDVARVFYFGESVLLPAYRGHGIGVGFFREREAHARSLGRFGHVAFCGVVRPPGHPRRLRTTPRSTNSGASADLRPSMGWWARSAGATSTRPRRRPSLCSSGSRGWHERPPAPARHGAMSDRSAREVAGR